MRAPCLRCRQADLRRRIDADVRAEGHRRFQAEARDLAISVFPLTELPPRASTDGGGGHAVRWGLGNDRLRLRRSSRLA